ncbi:MAG: hypothetical protein EA411_12755 [Saprospirales bacterium]|nr:MAG: hypothetical protein EA411_12755 [Saprospirales bacterium]
MIKSKAWSIAISCLLLLSMIGIGIYGIQIIINVVPLGVFLGVLNSYKEGSLFERLRDPFLLFLGLVGIGVYQTHMGYMYLPGWRFVLFLVVPLFFYVLGFFLAKLNFVRNNGRYVFPAVFLLFMFTCLGVVNPYSFWLALSYVLSVFVLSLALFKYRYSAREVVAINSPYFLIPTIGYVFSSGPNLQVVLVQFIGTVIALFLAKYVAGRFTAERKFYPAGFLAALILMAGTYLTHVNSFYYIEYSKEVGTLDLDTPLVYQGDTIAIDDFKGKTLVLDFWHTRCRYCFDEFPKFEKLSRKYSDRDDIKFFSVNVPLRIDEEGEAKERIESLGYSFEHLFMVSKTDHTLFGVQSFPTVVYIDAEQNTMISGSLETSPLVANNSISVISRLLDQ